MHLENLREVCHTTVHRETRPGVGHHVTFTEELYDPDGNLVSTSEGMAVVFGNPEDGGLMQLMTATEKLADGVISWTGTVRQEDPNSGEFAVNRLPAIGVSGRYAGKTGTRTFKFVERPDDHTTIAEATIYMED
ncbi:allene oxide cyclase barrel-like domain-containing protein [Actinomadura sp. 3N407]|uniref:allene oxide cyclase barrel-like domain-containing protein n=1 Tax=Actinomadura sp. 3N407 TaxID=3457423 RepID=UPI003FCC46FC